MEEDNLFDELAADEQPSRADNRFKDLSNKVKDTAKERDEAKAKVEAAEAAQLAAEKERDFYSSFTDSTSQYPQAIEFKDVIKEKVMSGYTVEDATVAVLAKEGKLTVPTVPEPVSESPAGGSATNALKSDGDKPLSEMTRDEKREVLENLEKRGDISLS